MNSNALYVRVLLVLIALVVLLTFLNRNSRPSAAGSWVPSSFNPVGAGHQAFYTALQDSSWPVMRWREPLSRLSPYGRGNVLLITRSRVGSRAAFSDDEIDILTHWVRQGNTLVLLGALDQWDDTRALLHSFGFGLVENTPSRVEGFFQPLETHSGPDLVLEPAPNSGIKGSLIIPNTPPLPGVVPQEARPLFQHNGQSYMAEVPFGTGRLIVGTTALLLDNQFLGRGENLSQVIHLLAPHGQLPAHLFFEESHHGYASIFALVNLLHNPGFRFGAMLALLGLVTFLGSSLIRFGAVIPLQQAKGRSTLEFVDSVADLYQRADLRNAMIASLYQETRRRVLQRLNLPATASPDQISTHLAQAFPHLPRWKKLAQRFESKDHVGGLPPSGWFRLAYDLIEVKSVLA